MELNCFLSSDQRGGAERSGWWWGDVGEGGGRRMSSEDVREKELHTHIFFFRFFSLQVITKY